MEASGSGNVAINIGEGSDDRENLDAYREVFIDDEQRGGKISK